MDGDTYERWVAGVDVDTGAKKGRLRTDADGLRFVEVIVNGPKTWSLAAALHPEISDALDAAQDRAAAEIVGWVAQHATTRIGPRGRQVQVPVEQIEAAVIRHYTSRAGDPHRHLHLQVNARVRAAGAWRGSTRSGSATCIEAINGIGHAAVATDPEFRAVLAEHGLHHRPRDQRDPSAQAIRRGVQRSGGADPPQHRPLRGRVAWRASGRGARTTAAGRRGTGAPGRRRAPTRSSPATAPSWSRGGTASCATSATTTQRRRWRWTGRGRGGSTATRSPTWSSRSWGHRSRRGTPPTSAARPRCCSPRPAWSPTRAARVELAEDITARATNRCTRLLEGSEVPEHVRALTSPRVLDVEADLITRLARRGTEPARRARIGGRGLVRVDPTQAAVVGALAGDGDLVVVEGAAGAGKTTALRSTQDPSRPGEGTGWWW